MVEIELARIVMRENKKEQMVVLREKQGTRAFSMVVGITEASAIKLEINRIRLPRPMTHDLLKNIIENLGAVVQRVIIDKLQKGTFYAKLILSERGGREIIVDARPSDSIALALRAGCPIFASEDLLKKTAMAKSA